MLNLTYFGEKYVKVFRPFFQGRQLLLHSVCFPAYQSTSEKEFTLTGNNMHAPVETRVQIFTFRAEPFHKERKIILTALIP